MILKIKCKNYKCIIAVEVLIVFLCLLWFLVSFLMIDYINNWNYKLSNFSLKSNNHYITINTLIVILPFILAYIIRPIFILLKWSFKTLQDNQFEN